MSTLRILHTSDWHLGQSFFTQTRQVEHEQFIDWLLFTVEAEKVDAVIIAGDIFDTGSPPSYAREMYARFVARLQEKDCQLVVLGGNHDSVSMLNESQPVLEYLNTQVIASTGIALDKQIVNIKNKEGNIAAIVCAVPFIRPKDVIESQAGQTPDEKSRAMSKAISDHYHLIHQEAKKRRNQLNVDVPIIATGHLTAVGATLSDSVRDIYIGTLEAFHADGFPDVDYIALGHIHRPQKVAGKEHIRYCGSPIPLAFDEVNTQKQVVLVEFEGATRQQITPIDIPVFQAMATLRCSLDELEEQIKAIPSVKDNIPTWLSIEIQTQDYLSDLQSRVQEIVAEYPVDILQLRRARQAQSPALKQEKNETLSDLSPEEVFEKRLAMEVFEGDASQALLERIKKRFTAALSEVITGEAES
ncbi:exonuclease subunit SbcD [Alteromonas sp. McT4-15]|uniref:exonuclease subunit SbcD n=1 Tax=Alteromonas sp. McT4-15 TaxID=2881256 RepID=UPI001CF90063|nr:exonuclease subunit SbcD [Alteromonas sp. McT4-15]MCB4435546.1 exonuclease subunit SbcD [Alteromonas sp. McT4-15]